MAKQTHESPGQPTKYKPEYAEQVYKLCLLKAIDKDLAKFFDVCEDTINNWKKDYLDFFESIKRGKLIADATVAEKLFERACGYSHPDVHISNYQGDITITDIIKHYPPDTAAAFIWLKNRAGWTDRQTTVLDVSPEVQTVLGLINGSTKGKLPGDDPRDSSKAS